MMIPTNVWLGCGVWAIWATSLVVTAAVVHLASWLQETEPSPSSWPFLCEAVPVQC